MIYLDTGCLLKLYYPEPESRRVAERVAGKAIAFVPLHDLELTNALALKVFRREARPAQAKAVSEALAADVRSGALYRPDLSWDDVLHDSKGLAATHTAKFGTRSLDILHCAAARLLQVAEFVTTDDRQRKLALAIGLVCPRI
jgi:predicted nucleic acid-binding protein